MTTLRFALLGLLREWKSGEVLILAAALIVAVTALTAVGFFTDRIGQAVARQANEVIAADLRLQSGEPLPDALVTDATAQGLSTARIESFPSVIVFGQDSTLAMIRAVAPGYPLRGAVEITDTPFAEGNETHAIPGTSEVWLEPTLLARLGAHVGDDVTIGAATLHVTQVLAYRPDQGSAAFDLAPSLLMNIDDVAATTLIQPGSRITYTLLFAGPAAAVERFKAELDANKQPGERLVDAAEASPQIQTSVDRAGRFLNLSALMTVLLAAVAVAMAARRYVRRHLDGVAMMKCLGASRAFVLRVTALQLATLALVASATGAAAGYVTQQALAWLLRDLVRGSLPPPSPAPALLGLLTATTILIGFALPPVLRLSRVPPARVLRRNLEPPPLRYAANYVVAAFALLAIVFWLVRDPKLVALVAGGTAAMLAVLWLAGFALVRAAGSLRGVGGSWRYGVANLSRRGAENAVQVVAFGVGLMVLLLLGVVRNDLMAEWEASLPADTPNHYLVNIRPDQQEALRGFLAERDVDAPAIFPIARARLTAIDHQPIGELDLADGRGQRFAEREQGLSWSEALPEDNRVVEGRWWVASDTGRRIISVSSEFAQELGLKLGDTVSFDIAGEAIDSEIVSIRGIRWDNFRPNFHVLFPPGALDGLIGTSVAAIRLDTSKRAMLIDLVRAFPNVSFIDLDAILAEIRQVMDRASLAVEAVFLFTLVAGVTVLLAAIQSTRDERRYESAMLRALGASRRVVLAALATEFTVLGVLAGLLAAAGASLGGWLIATQLLDLQYAFSAAVAPIGLALGALIVGGAGTLATLGVVNHPPLTTLREA